MRSSEGGGFLVRPATPGDEGGVREVVVAAFGHERVADLWSAVVARGLARASFVAVADDEVVGHVGVSHAWLDARRALVDVWMLSPLSTRPGCERRGVGTALVAAAVDAARASGVPALFLEGSPAFYGARGFESATARGFGSASVRTPDRAFQVVTFDAHEEWMSGALVYHDVWWEHEAAGLRDPDLAGLERLLGEGRTDVRR